MWFDNYNRCEATNLHISLSAKLLTMKRKTDCRSESVDGNGQPDAKRRALSNENTTDRFREGLLSHENLEEYKKRYANSEP